jgi:HK97 gp10 family phage protein
MKTTVHIEGMEALKRAFKELEPKLAKKVIRQAERKGAKLFADEIRAHTPVKSGKLKKTVKVRTSKGPRGAKKQIAMAVLVGQAGAGDDKSGGGKPAWYAYLQEKGFTIGKRIRKAGKTVGYTPTGKRNSVGKVPGKFFVRHALKSKETSARELVVSEILAGVEREAGK